MFSFFRLVKIIACVALCERAASVFANDDAYSAPEDLLYSRLPTLLPLLSIRGEVDG